jgi:hypothetical protein
MSSPADLIDMPLQGRMDMPQLLVSAAAGIDNSFRNFAGMLLLMLSEFIVTKGLSP